MEMDIELDLSQTPPNSKFLGSLDFEDIISTIIFTDYATKSLKLNILDRECEQVRLTQIFKNQSEKWKSTILSKVMSYYG